MTVATKSISVALVNDYEIIVEGLAAMLAPYSDRVRVVEMTAGDEPRRMADVALFDTFAGRRHAITRAREMAQAGRVEHVVLYTWDASAEFLALADAAGVSGVVLKSQTGATLVEVIERVVQGERVGLETTQRGRQARDKVLSSREKEVLALIALGMTNSEIGSELFLSVDTVKTYVRRLYAKLGVKNRAQAAFAPRVTMSCPLRRAKHVLCVDGCHARLAAIEPGTTSRRAVNVRRPTLGVLDREYDGTTSTLRAARNDVVEWITEQRMDQDLLDRAALVVSELTSNAVQASPGSAYGVRASIDDEGALVMAVTSRTADGVLPPRDQWGPETVLAPRGRGLLIVSKLSDHVDVDQSGADTVIVTSTLRAASQA